MQKTLDWIYLTALRCMHSLKESRRQWATYEDADDVRVFYGVDQLPFRNECASGGIIKCQDLEKFFPNVPQGSNLMYLVSSALPVTSVYMAHRAIGAGAKVVLNQNGVAYPAWHGPGWERTNAPMRSLLECADFVVYQNEFCKESADKWVYKRESRYEIVYNAVDTSVFTPGPTRETNAPFKLLLTGSHHSWERIDTALLTLKELINRGSAFRLIVAGRLAWSRDAEAIKTRFWARCKEFAVEDSVDLRGPYTQEGAVELYREADILLHTQYNDPCPRVVLEAMSVGLPVVHSASGGVPELVGDTGVGIPSPKQWDELKWAAPVELADGVKDVALRYDVLSKAARSRCVEKFDVRNWVKKHVEIFRNLM